MSEPLEDKITTLPTETLPATRVSSRFLKPNRFRGSSQSRSSSEPQPTLTQTVQAPNSTSSNDQATTGAFLLTSTNLDLRSSSNTILLSSSSQVVGWEVNEQVSSTKSEVTEAGQQSTSEIQPTDASASVVVTYFTTTTHTIPFTINSETIFTTIEETNSRIATEFMPDLGGHFIEPTPVVTIAQPSTQTNPQVSSEPTTQESSSQAETTGRPTSERPMPPSPKAVEVGETSSVGEAKPPVAQIEPSFVLSSNTRTYFTTFTFFTTFSAGSATPSIKSSESTTSNVIVETATSSIEPASSSEGTSSTPSESRTPDGSSISATSSSADTQATETSLFGTPLLSTLYNATQTLSTPIVDASAQVPSQPVSTTAETDSSVLVSDKQLTFSPALVPAPTTELPRPTLELESLSTSIGPGKTASEPNKMTRTRSLYTTLTHYITFYSGTKTQLSTIQEISPTVVTEYVDRTLFEQAQKEPIQYLDSGAAKSPASLEINPSERMPSDDQITPTLAPPPVILSSSAVANSVAPTSVVDQPPPIMSKRDEGELISPAPGSTASSTTATAAASTTTTISPMERPELDSVQVNGPHIPSSDNQSAEPRQVSPPGGQNEEYSNKQPATSIIELSDLIAYNSSQSGRPALTSNLGAAIKDIVQLLAGNKTNIPHSLVPSSPESEQVVTTVSPTTQQPSIMSKKTATRLYGQKAREQQLSLQGSLTSPSVTTTSSFTETASSAMTGRMTTVELVASSEISSHPQHPVATIFFGDDGGDERKKQVKTVWPAPQSTAYFTNVEPSTRSLIVTTTKIYYNTHDAPLTLTSSFTSVIAPRTFVSTVIGTRTLVNQLSTQTAQLVGNSSVERHSVKPLQPTRHDSQAASHRLSVQQKQQKQQQHLEQQQKKQQAIVSKSKPTSKPTELQMTASANINQCQPMCKISNNEICKFTPSSETIGSQGTFSCTCRPGYFMTTNAVGQRQCQEVQSYIVLLRLLQVGEQQVHFKRELQDRSSSEFKQISRIVKDQIKRAYMTSDLTRDRFISADILNYAKSLDSQVGAVTSQGKLSNASSTNPQGSSGGGAIVNITVQLQPPANANEALDENTLKEELTKKLNLRQAAALAIATNTEQLFDGQTTLAEQVANSSQTDERLPNPNALFLADVEQVSDLDECANPIFNDCHDGAVCINEIGSYKCDCRDYPDLNPLHPGRQCANEIKSCDYCNNRGDCIRVPSLITTQVNNHSSNAGRGQVHSTICQCHRIYLGRRCEINGLRKFCILVPRSETLKSSPTNSHQIYSQSLQHCYR